MGYIKTVWVNDETPLNQENMNKIETALDELFTGVDLSHTSISDLDILLDQTIDRVIDEEVKSTSFTERLDILDLHGGRVYEIELKNTAQDNRLDDLDDVETGHVKRLDDRIDLSVLEAQRLDTDKTEKTYSQALEIRITAAEDAAVLTDENVTLLLNALDLDGDM